MKFILQLSVLLLLSSCANMVAPTGGAKDSEAPNCVDQKQHIEINNNKESKLTYEFEERIQEHKFAGNFYISPPLNGVTHKIKGNILEIFIKDSIPENLLFTISFGNCIKDLTEGNVLTKFVDEFYSYKVSEMNINLHLLDGWIHNSLTDEVEKEHWVLLYNSEIPDSLVFKTNPNYVSKTDKDGYFLFNNIIDGDYKIVSLSGEDYIYHEDEILSFSDKLIITGTDTTIDLFTFNLLHEIDSSEIVKDTTIFEGGNLTLKSDFSGNIIVQLLKGDKVVLQENFENSSDFTLKNIPTGEYSVRAFSDKNNNGFWDTGSFTEKRQAEEMCHYFEKITIRENWDLELEWFITE